MKEKKDTKQSKLVRRGESPEEALCRNVILQALTDATMVISDKVKEAQRRDLQRIRDQARDWIESQHQNFRMFCDLAGLEASRVHQFAMAKIRESIQREHVRTAELLTSTVPGVGVNFCSGPQDRPTSDTRDGEQIGFSTQDENTSLDKSLSSANSNELAAAEVKP